MLGGEKVVRKIGKKGEEAKRSVDGEVYKVFVKAFMRSQDRAWAAKMGGEKRWRRTKALRLVRIGYRKRALKSGDKSN